MPIRDPEPGRVRGRHSDQQGEDRLLQVQRQRNVPGSCPCLQRPGV